MLSMQVTLPPRGVGLGLGVCVGGVPVGSVLQQKRAGCWEQGFKTIN